MFLVLSFILKNLELLDFVLSMLGFGNLNQLIHHPQARSMPTRRLPHAF